MTAMLISNRLISPQDDTKLQSFKPSFPLSFETFIQTITQVFGDKEIKDLKNIIDESREQIENCRTWINMINVKQLSADELHQLAIILHTCMKKS